MRDRTIVIGDVIIDQYNRGGAIGISAETPTIVAELEKTELFVGGAGLVVRHLLRLGQKVDLLTAVGVGERSIINLIEMSSDPFIDDEIHMFYDSSIVIDGWKTTTKIRNFVGNYKMLQYDVRNSIRLDDRSRQSMIVQFDILFDRARNVVICDNRHGAVDAQLARHVIEKCASKHVPVFVDSQCSQNEANHADYVYADVFFMNEREVDSLVRGNWELDGATKENQAEFVRKFLLAKKVILKLGAAGATEFSTWGGIHMPGEKVATVDTCGAGDAFLAAYVATGSIEKANHWAALSTTYLGTIVPKEKL